MSRVALLHNLDRGQSERQTEFDSPETIAMLGSFIAQDHDCTPVEATPDMAWIPILCDYKPDIVFNVAEGFHGAAREAVYPAILEQLGMRYCGPDPTNLAVTLNKHLTKHLLTGIPGLEIPESCVWNEDFDFSALRRGRYLLKLMHEGSSIGMRLADGPEDVPTIARTLQEQYADAIMVEEYVEGTDISMAYVEGLGTLGPARVDLPDGDFYDYDLKSNRDEEVQIGAPAVSPDIQDVLHAITDAVARRLDLKGYSKMDMRVEGDRVHFIEVNGQVSFHPEGEFAYCCQAGGYSLGDVVRSIVQSGLRTPRRVSIGVNR